MVRNIFYIIILTIVFLSQSELINGVYDPNQPPINERKQYIENEVIVEFKVGRDPDTLNAKVMQQAKLSKSFLGKVRVMITNMIAKNSPMSDLRMLESADKQAGAVKQELLGSEVDNLTYTITLDGKKSVEKAVEIYSKLPIVKSAEPNYLFYPLNQSLP